MDLLQPMMVAALLISGQGVALLGSVKVPLSKRLQIDEARVGGLVSLFGFAMIPAILLAGFLTDQAGRQVVMMVGSALFAASLFVLAWASNRGWNSEFASSTVSTRTDAGSRRLTARRKFGRGIGFSMLNAATCPSACTPASVRPDPAT